MRQILRSSSFTLPRCLLRRAPPFFTCITTPQTHPPRRQRPCATKTGTSFSTRRAARCRSKSSRPRASLCRKTTAALHRATTVCLCRLIHPFVARLADFLVQGRIRHRSSLASCRGFRKADHSAFPCILGRYQAMSECKPCQA